jgi:uncharacterized RDD family membrane protein YckC
VKHFVARDLRPAFWRRAAAYVIDSLIVTAIWFAAIVFVLALEDGSGSENDAGPVFTTVLLALPLFWVIYQWVCSALGRSPGKMTVGLEIVRVTGFKLLPVVRRPGVRRGLLRSLGLFFGAISFGLGYWWALWDNGRRSWGDKVAATRVIRTTRSFRIPKPDRRGRILFRDPVGGPPMRRFLKFAAIGLPLYYLSYVAWDATRGEDLTPIRLLILLLAIPLGGISLFGVFVLRQIGTWVQLTEKGLTINSIVGFTPGGPSSMRRNVPYAQIRALVVIKADKLRVEYWNDKKKRWSTKWLIWTTLWYLIS